MKSDRILENLIYLTVLGLPLYLVRTKIGPIPTNVLEIFVGIIFLIWIFSNRKKIKIADFFSKYRKYVYALSLILGGLLLSTISNGNTQESWGIIKGWFIVPIILVLLCGKIIKKEKIEQVFWMYFFSAVVISLLSIGYFFAGSLTYDGRLSAMFDSPNYLAMYLAPAVVIFVFQKGVNKTKLILPLGLVLIALYLTYSYASWLAIIISLVIALYWENKDNLKKNFFIKILAIVGVAMMLTFSQSDKDKFKTLVTLQERTSVASRIIVWRASGKMIEDNFWLGIGPGNFQKAYLQYQGFYEPYLEWEMPHPNNLFLTFWLYSGVFGLIGFLGLVFLFFQNLLYRVKKEPKRVLFISLGIMLIILIHGIFDTTYFKNDLAVIFWLNFLALK